MAALHMRLSHLLFRGRHPAWGYADDVLFRSPPRAPPMLMCCAGFSFRTHLNGRKRKSDNTEQVQETDNTTKTIEQTHENHNLGKSFSELGTVPAHWLRLPENMCCICSTKNTHASERGRHVCELCEKDARFPRVAFVHFQRIH